MTDPTPPAILTAAQIDGMSAAYPDVVMPDSIGLWLSWFIEQNNAPGIHTARSHQQLYRACIELRRQVVEVTQVAQSRLAAHDRMEQQLQHRTLTLGAAVQRAEKAERLLTDTVAWLKAELRCNGEDATLEVQALIARLDPPQDH